MSYENSYKYGNLSIIAKYFEAIIVSEEVEVLKPDPKIF